jgi:hypothetical protein
MAINKYFISNLSNQRSTRGDNRADQLTFYHESSLLWQMPALCVAEPSSLFSGRAEVVKTLTHATSFAACGPLSICSSGVTWLSMLLCSICRLSTALGVAVDSCVLARLLWHGLSDRSPRPLHNGFASREVAAERGADF